MATAPVREFSCVQTDSRKATPGSLFVALPGEKFDGHDFIALAIEKGATGILCRKGSKVPAQALAYEVEDTLQAYRALAAAWRSQVQIPVLAVAGSNGKTTTKELLAALLSGKFRKVLKTTGSQNGFVGIPMTLLELNSQHDAAVIEIGIDEPGAMIQHLELVRPTASVVTSIGPEHLEKFRDLETIAREECLALSWVAERGGTVSINVDDPAISAWLKSTGGTLASGSSIRTSLAQPAGDRLLHGEFDRASGSLILSGLGLGSMRVAPPLPGEHNARNLLAAVSLALSLGLSPLEIQAGLGRFEGATGRSQLFELPGSIRVLCDYYNANPASMQAGLQVLDQLAGAGERWVCLGDMLELGPDEDRFHRELATPLLSLRIEHTLLYGPRMRSLADELGKRGYSGAVHHYDSHAALAQDLIASVKPGSAILIKGSRGMRMEEVWKPLQSRFQSP